MTTTVTLSSLSNLALQTKRAPQAAAAAAPSGPVDFSINHQDSTVMSSSTITLNINSDISTDKVKLLGGMTPNANGNYVFPDKDKNFTNSNAFAAVAHAVDLAQTVSGEKINWATGKAKLEVTPDAGTDFNAYYSRQKGGLFFFEDVDPVTNETIYSGNSSEVTSHEGWHAILDAKRPHYLGSFSPDPGAFHEAMGDIGAMVTTLHNPEVVDLVAKQTGGDFTKQNAAAALGEQLGIAINHYTGKNATGGPWTRNAINNFTWQDTSTLPSSAPPDHLSKEVHSLSRLWSGATYDILGAIVKQNMADGQDVKAAITGAADEVLKMQFRLLKAGNAPDGSFKFKDMAKALVKSENELNGGKYTGIIKSVMDARKILPASEAGLVEDSVAVGSHEVSTTLSGDRFGQFAGARVSQINSGDAPRGFAESDASKKELENDMAALIEAGDIKMTEPNEDPSKVNLFKANGEPFRGVVRWESGQPVIEPTLIAG